MVEKVPVIDQRTRPGHGVVWKFNGKPTVIVDDPHEITADDWYDLNDQWIPASKAVVDRARYERLRRIAHAAANRDDREVRRAVAMLTRGDLEPLDDH